MALKRGLEVIAKFIRYGDAARGIYAIWYSNSLTGYYLHFNTIKSSLPAITSIFWDKSQGNSRKFLQGASGIIKPSRLTLLLGPPGYGKTTLLKALLGELDQSLKVAVIYSTTVTRSASL